MKTLIITTQFNQDNLEPLFDAVRGLASFSNFTFDEDGDVTFELHLSELVTQAELNAILRDYQLDELCDSTSELF